MKQNNKSTQDKNYNLQKLYHYSIWLLSKKSYTSFELIAKMQQYQQDILVIESVILKLKEYKYIDDDSFLNRFVEYNFSKLGVRKIQHKLLQKGFSAKQIKDSIFKIQEFELENKQNYETENSQVTLAHNLLVKKYKVFQSDNYNKYCSFLSSSGFSFDTIKKSINIFKKN